MKSMISSLQNLVKMNSSKLLSFISIARKAGALKVGLQFSLKEISKGNAKLVILSADASENTKKAIRNASNYKGIPMIESYSKQDLGNCIGKEEISAIAVTDKGIAKRIIELSHEKDEGSFSE